MAYFKKYNGYYVKDANALAHASIDGNTLTTTNREGNVVDTLTLPGGSSHISATSMAYHNPSIDASYSLCFTSMFNGNPNMSLSSILGQVMSDEMIGYGDIDYDGSIWTLNSIRAQTIRSWDTYDRTDMMGGAGHDTNNVGDVDSFEDNASMLHRKARYKTYLCVGRPDSYISVPANSAKRIMATSGDGGYNGEPKNYLPVKAPNGVVQGYATIVGVKPMLACSLTTDSSISIDRAGLIMYYDKTGGVIAYNVTAASIRVDAFILELEVVLESQYCEFRYWINNDPYIKYLNIEEPIGDINSDITVKNNIIVHSAVGSTDKKLFEYKLKQNSNGTWYWARSTIAIPNTDSSTYYNTKIVREHAIYNGTTFEYDDYTSAVVYAIGPGTSIVGDAFFTDALPIPHPFNIYKV